MQRSGGPGRGPRGSRFGPKSQRGRMNIANPPPPSEMVDLNYENIFRMDSKIKCIVDHASHAAVFTYTNDQWHEAVAVGSLFLYERFASDQLGMVIMNRQSVENWTHIATEKFEVVIQPPYWIVKDENAIFCVWFYDGNDPTKLAGVLKRFELSVVNSEIGNKSPSSIKPPNLVTSSGNSKTGQTPGDSILSMLTKQKSAPAEIETPKLSTDLLNLIAKPEFTKAEDSVAHPVPIKAEPGALHSKHTLKESPKSRVQLRTPGASSFAEVAAWPKKEKEPRAAHEIPTKLERGSENKSGNGAFTMSTMQTVEQLEKGNLTEDHKKEVPKLGGHGFITHEHLAMISPPPERAHQDMTNDLRTKLGLPPFIYDVSPDIATEKPVDTVGVTKIRSKDSKLRASDVPPRSKVGDNGGWEYAPMTVDDIISPAKHQQNKGNSELGQLKEGGASGKYKKNTSNKSSRFRASNNFSEERQPIEQKQKPAKHEVMVNNPPSTRQIIGNAYLALEPRHDGRSQAAKPSSSATQTENEVKKIGIQNLALTADELVKTFQVLLRDEEFVAKFHNAYLQVRSEEGA